jgi:predicted enzyme related to lactoylglutathione lyase
MRPGYDLSGCLLCTSTLVYLTVDNMDGMLIRVHASGGKTLTPKMQIGADGFIAHFEDSEGNRVARHSNE